MAQESQVEKHINFVGGRSKALTVDQFTEWFDELTGPEGRELKSYPATLFSVYVKWQGADGLWTKPASFDELVDAYAKFQTYSIHIGTLGSAGPQLDASYFPGASPPRVEVSARGNAVDVDRIARATSALFPDPVHQPMVFLSWGGSQSHQFAQSFKRVLAPRSPRSNVFLSSESIEVGSDPLRAMLDDGVLRAKVLVVFLTGEAASHAWTVWETAAAWARGAKVIPIFVNVDPSQVPGPLTTRVQGVPIEDRTKLDEALRVVARELGEAEPDPLTDEEFRELCWSS